MTPAKMDRKTHRKPQRKTRAKTHQPQRARRPKATHAPRRAPRRRMLAVRETIATLSTWRARAVSALRRHPTRAALGAVALAAALTAGIARR
jgi:hypothetical protein